MAPVSKLIGNRLFSAAFLFLRSFALFAPSLKNDFVWDNIKVVTKINYSFTPPGIISCAIPKSLAKKKERYLYIPSAGFCILIGYLIIATGSGVPLKSIA